MPRLALIRILAALAVAVLASPAGADTYKWVDEKGVVNYSNTPPVNRKSVKLDDEQGRVSTIEAYDYSRGGAAKREQALQERVARLEREVARGRQTAALDAAAAAEAYRAWREQCFAERRVDCDDPYAASFDPGYAYPSPGVAVVPARRVPGAYRPTGRIAVGAGGVVGPYFKPPLGGIAVGPGPYGIGAGYHRAAPGGVVVGPGPYGIGAAYYPVPEETRPLRLEPRTRPRR
ncbi:MAG: DUF4124 domain-containing protein [Gemmatimonadales bacterium]